MKGSILWWIWKVIEGKIWPSGDNLYYLVMIMQYPFNVVSELANTDLIQCLEWIVFGILVNTELNNSINP